MADDQDERVGRIERLKAEAAALAGGELMTAGDERLPPELQEQFWQRVVDFESCGTTTLVIELTRIDVPLPEPDGLDDSALHTALWKVIDGLATLGVFLESTDHLSDRELYTQLVRVTLPEEMDALDDTENSAVHVDVLGYDQPALYLKYYADERVREAFRPYFPDGIPAHEDPPFDRDSRLPAPWWMTDDNS